MFGQIAGSIFLIGGLFFCTVGVMGIIRFPDVYSRIHASGKVSSLGIIGLLIGTGILMPATALELIVLGLFLLVSAPVASHAIALAAHRQGVPWMNVVRDDLENYELRVE